jgi:hypothetical protein
LRSLKNHEFRGIEFYEGISLGFGAPLQQRLVSSLEIFFFIKIDNTGDCCDGQNNDKNKDPLIFCCYHNIIHQGKGI